MVDYREIIRLNSLKFSNLAIANSLCCSRNTVSEVLKLAETHSLGWPIPDTLTNSDIEHIFYPDRGNNEGRKLPDYEYVYNEIINAKNLGKPKVYRDFYLLCLFLFIVNAKSYGCAAADEQQSNPQPQVAVIPCFRRFGLYGEFIYKIDACYRFV